MAGSIVVYIECRNVQDATRSKDEISKTSPASREAKHMSEATENTLKILERLKGSYLKWTKIISLNVLGGLMHMPYGPDAHTRRGPVKGASHILVPSSEGPGPSDAASLRRGVTPVASGIPFTSRSPSALSASVLLKQAAAHEHARYTTLPKQKAPRTRFPSSPDALFTVQRYEAITAACTALCRGANIGKRAPRPPGRAEEGAEEGAPATPVVDEDLILAFVMDDVNTDADQAAAPASAWDSASVAGSDTAESPLGSRARRVCILAQNWVRALIEPLGNASNSEDPCYSPSGIRPSIGEKKKKGPTTQRVLPASS
ncbi:hypothetical protein DFH06DRAFT_1140421 [Mycena polygramma]|nr:hypothetical protein DFH06DRAFT_1140421 [Mycena polygramma]